MRQRRFKPGVTCWHRQLGWKGTVIEVRKSMFGRIVLVDLIGMTGVYYPEELRLTPP